MKAEEVQRLVDAYLAVRNSYEDLTPTQTAGFLIAKFGAIEAIRLIRDIGKSPIPVFWQDVTNELSTTIRGD
jgi:hypothetical protein